MLSETDHSDVSDKASLPHWKYVDSNTELLDGSDGIIPYVVRDGAPLAGDDSENSSAYKDFGSDGSPSESSPEKKSEYKYRSSWKRWIMLFIISANSFLNAVIWITFAPVASIICEYYSTNDFGVNLFSVVFMLPIWFIIAAVVSPYLSLRWTGVIGAVGNAISCWVRLAGGFRYGCGITDAYIAPFIGPVCLSFWVLFVGQSLAALAQPFCLSPITLLTKNWFGENERTVSTSISSMSNLLGSGLGMVLSGLIITNGTGLVIMLAMQAIITTVIAILAVCFLRSRPDHPPSSAAELPDQSQGFLSDVWLLLKDKWFWSLLVMFTNGMSVFVTLATLMNEIFVPYGYSSTVVGIWGGLFMLAGLGGAAVFAPLVDWLHAYKGIILVGQTSAVLCLIALYFAVTSGHFILLTVLMALMGFVSLGIFPVFLEFSAVAFFPVPEPISSTVFFLVGQSVGVVFIVVIPLLLPGTEARNVFLLFALMGMVTMGLAALYRGPYRRLIYERSIKEGDELLPVSGMTSEKVSDERSALLDAAPNPLDASSRKSGSKHAPLYSASAERLPFLEPVGGSATR
jgi:MFS transporter, FLVCR family, MFS-domain-containing protein 7